MAAKTLAHLIGYCIALVAAASGNPSAFDWDDITPSRDLQYHDCFGEHKCARLEMPLNWLDGNDNRTTAIAIIKRPAKVPDNDPTFAGSVLINPGGPGGSGVSLLLGGGLPIQDRLDNERRRYEIIGFDPRGVNNSTPHALCFESQPNRDSFNLQLQATGGIAAGPDAIKFGQALHQGYGESCQNLDKASGSIMGFTGTASVARDMVEIIDKIDELRKAAGGTSKGKARLQYIGFSYGTVLGNYFASMFPERVGRMVLDSVADATDYGSAPGWTTNLVDTDKVFDTFIDACFEAGTETCSLRLKNDTNAQAIRSRVWDFIDGLKNTPLSVKAKDGTVLVVTDKDVKGMIGMWLYSIQREPELVARILAQMVTGNSTLLSAALINSNSGLQNSSSVARNGSDTTSLEDSHNAILCGEADDVSEKDVSFWKDYTDKLAAQSRIFGGTWAEGRFACSGWRIRNSFTFKGPFTTPPADLSLVDGKPAAPLLFVSNLFDPVTPLQAARAMAAAHPGAGVVVQNAIGHGALLLDANKKSCVAEVVSNYFEFGTIPDASKMNCNTTCGIFETSCLARNSSQKNGASLNLEFEGQSTLRLASFPLFST